MQNDSGIDTLISAIRDLVSANAPELLDLYDMYAQEARFARQLLSENLQNLKPGDEVLEVGAGMYLLACQLRREGINIVALEPIGEGFPHFYRLQQLVLDHAKQQAIQPTEIMPITGEELEITNRFAFAYSINVMEHVTDVNEVLQRVYKSLKPGGIYRFICPNYTFPYESHFSIPIILNKKITWSLMKNKIKKSSPFEDYQSLWASLNWITVSSVKKICKRNLKLSPAFDKSTFEIYINRMFYDAEFQQRHNPLIRKALAVMNYLKLLKLIRLIPVRILPVMDCRIKKITHLI